MPIVERTDEEIVKEVQKGDAESFKILVERYEPKMARYAKRFLFAPDDAQDLSAGDFYKDIR